METVMSKKLNCEKCGLFLGELMKGPIRNGTKLLCNHCWEKADIAMQMADLATGQRKHDPALDSLREMFGMKG